MSRTMRALGAMLAALLLGEGLVHAQANPPDHYLCYGAGTIAGKKRSPIAGIEVELQDRFGGPRPFKLQRLAALCNPARLAGGSVSHEKVHLEGLPIKTERGAPKFVPFTLDVTDVFATRTLVVPALASLLDVTPVQPGTNPPADFSDDPTQASTELNRFKCYAAELPKGVKLVPPAPPLVIDEVFRNGQQFRIKKVTKVCFPAAVDGATPDAPARDTLRVCYAVKLPKGTKVPPLTVGTRSRTVGVRIVKRRKPVELCVTGQVSPINPAAAKR